jgi:hypothetical protein
MRSSSVFGSSSERIVGNPEIGDFRSETRLTVTRNGGKCWVAIDNHCFRIARHPTFLIKTSKCLSVPEAQIVWQGVTQG